jgi:hypothetical protein
MTRPTLLAAQLALAVALAACSGAPAAAPAEGPAEPSGPPAPEAAPADPTPAERAASINCGSSPSDWCASPPGDPCGAHRSADACSGDARCEGIPYAGESFVACQLDARCFATNCPTVGCVRRCEELDAAACRAAAPRCSVVGATCVRRESCASAEPPTPDTADVPAPDEGG